MLSNCLRAGILPALSNKVAAAIGPFRGSTKRLSLQLAHPLFKSKKRNKLTVELSRLAGVLGGACTEETLSNQPGEWLQCQANGSNVCRVIRPERANNVTAAMCPLSAAQCIAVCPAGGLELRLQASGFKVES